MNPVYKEKYVLDLQTYGHFTYDQNKEQLEHNKKMIKVTGIVQIVIGIIAAASVFLLKDMSMIFIAFAGFMVFTGVQGLIKKYPGYDTEIAVNIKKSYDGRGYGDNWFEVKFYEDHLKYNVGESIDELHYNDFHKFMDEENYFCIHFITGDLIIFNPDCDREKIKNIIISYRKKGLQEETVEAKLEAAEEKLEAKLEAVEDMIEAKTEALEEKAEEFADKIEEKIEKIIEG